MNNKIVLSCKGLSKTYHEGELHVDVLNNIDFSFSAGEKVAIVGPSGSGKSTLLHLLGGLDKPTQGEIYLDGENFIEMSEKRRCFLRNRHLGFIYQFHHLLPEFTALENVAMPLLIRGTSVEIAREKARDMLAKVKLSPRENHKSAQMSGGERQRTAIARALVTEPTCILADEPTGNLDHRTAEYVYQTLFDLNEHFHTSLLIVTHDMRLSKYMDKVLTLENGRLT